MISRRLFLRAIPAVLAAPAIVRVSSLMPVAVLPYEEQLRAIGWTSFYDTVIVHKRFFEAMKNCETFGQAFLLAELVPSG